MTPEQITALRHRQRMSALEFAKLLGVSITTIRNIESGRQPPGKNLMAKLQQIQRRNASYQEIN